MKTVLRGSENYTLTVKLQPMTFNCTKITAVTAFLVLAVWSLNAQTTQEKKAKLTEQDVGMYNSTKSKEAQDFFDKGLDYYKKDDSKNALKWFKKAIEKDPGFVEALDNSGLCCRQLGDFENAKKYYSKSIDLFPTGNMAHQNLGIVYGIEKKYDLALEQYKILQKLDSTNPEGYYGAVTIYFALQDIKSAIVNARKTMLLYEASRSPYLKDAQYLLGLAYFNDGDKSKAKIYLQKAKDNGAEIPKDLAKSVGL